MSFTDTSIARGMFNPPRFVSTLLPLSPSHHRSLKKRSILFSQATQKFSFGSQCDSYRDARIRIRFLRLRIRMTD